MKILYIACGSGSDPTIGGSLERTIQISKRINAEVFYLTTTGGKKAIGKGFEIKTPLSSYQMDKKFILRQLWSYFLVFIKSPFLKLPEVDLVYLDSDGLWDIVPAWWYKRKHPKVKVISMNHHLESSSIGRLHQSISRWFIRKFNAVFVLNTPMGERIKQVIGHPKTYFVWDGIDTKQIVSVPEQSKSFDACFFGTLRPGKGLYFIVPIWQAVCKIKPDAQLLIIGDMLPHYRKELDNEIEEALMEDNIEISGYIPNKDEAIKLVKKCKVFMSPSLEEGWGITIMECLASNLWGVVFDLATFSNIITQGVAKVPLSGFTLEQAFAHQILRLLSFLPILPPTLPFVLKYDWDNVAQKEMRIYEDLLCNK